MNKEAFEKEIYEQLESINEVQQQLVKKISAWENRETVAPQVEAQGHDTEDLRQIRDGIGQLSCLGQELKTKVELLTQMITAMPPVIPVRHHHHFDLRTRSVVIAAAALLLTAAISMGLLSHFWLDNGRLKEQSLKYRMIRQSAPNVALWADTTYLRDPKAANIRTKKLEAAEEARNRAEVIAKEKEKEAAQARKEAESWKQKKQPR